MPFISQRQIGLNLRSKAEKDYKAQLRSALLNPTLSAEQRLDIRARLARVGQPRVYDASSPPLPGAIQLPSQPVVAMKIPALPELDHAALQGMKKTDLQELAGQRGVPTTGTRANIIQRLLAV